MARNEERSRRGNMTVAEAGRLGGQKVSQDREHMAEIGRKGGQNSHRGGRREQTSQQEEQR